MESVFSPFLKIDGKFLILEKGTVFICNNGEIENNY